MKCFVLLTMSVFASKNENDVESAATNSGEKSMENATAKPIVVKIEEDEYAKKRASNYIGLTYKDRNSKWEVTRWNRIEKKNVHNGYHTDEETAAHASDTLARKLMANGEQNLKLNFPDDTTEVYREKKTSSEFIGVSYNVSRSKWSAYRWSKTEHKDFYNGLYKSEESAAHASDTLARQLMANGEQNLKLNFPDDSTDVHAEKKIYNYKYLGVYYSERHKKWVAQRWSKTEKKLFNGGSYRDEVTAAHASDTLATELMANGEQNHKLNFPDDNTEEQPQKQTNKRKRSFDFGYSQADKNTLEKLEEKKE